MKRTIVINYRHKDRLFISLFGNAERKENTLELYNAVNGTHYDNPDDITIITIEDALYMGMKNDVAFLIACHMNLYEHQSTYNPNMPLRGLMYLARLYEKYIKTNHLRIHGAFRITLPTPRYLVFYNGEEERPEKEELRLTDAFERPEESCVEVTATMVNVNAGKSRALLDRTATLDGYARFVAMVRSYRKEMTVEAAVEKAVTECIEQGILADYLLERRSEVMDMLLTEYNEEEVMQGFYQDGLEQGLMQGREQGRVLTYLNMRRQGMEIEKAGALAEIGPEAIQKAEDILNGDGTS